MDYCKRLKLICEVKFLLVLASFTTRIAQGAVMPLEADQGWILETANSAYVIGQSEGRVFNAWWGVKLDRKDYDVRPLHMPAFSDGPARLEYPGWGGMYYAEPTLKVQFADGNRDLQLKFSTAEIGTNTLTIQLCDEHYPIEIGLRYRVLESYDLIERWVEIRNVGEDAITLEQAGSALWHLPRQKQWRMRYLSGRWAAETNVREVDLNHGKWQIESRRGASSHQFNPWFAVHAGGAGEVNEQRGQVWFGQLAWSGSWKIAAEQTSAGLLQLYGGIHDFDFEWKLEPGEVFTTPKFIGGFSEEGFGGASRALANYQIDEVLPKRFAKETRPVIFNSWYATELNIDVAQQIRLAERAAEIGAELFVVDDGWFSGRKDDHGGLGDWTPDATKFPNGLKPLIEAVRVKGMKFGLWIEPEMVNRRSKLFEAHPDWVFAFPNRKGSEQRNQLMLNFAKPEVVEHLVGVIDRLLSENEIAFLKWDMNRHISEPGWSGAPCDRDREIWVRHVQGVYSLIDRLRAKHPDVLWENCSGGGGRADIGMLARMDQTWASDNTDPLDRLRIQFGYTHAFAAKTMVAWVTDNPDMMNKRNTPIEFAFRVASTGTLGIGGNLTKWSDAEVAKAKFHVSQYKRFRDLVQHGELYRMGAPEESACGFHYVDRERKKSAAYLFVNATHFGEDPVFRIPGLKADWKYKVVVEANGPEGKARELPILTGEALAEKGINLSLKGSFRSAVVSMEVME